MKKYEILIDETTGGLKMICPTCEGDGIERCDNPDHGFIQAMSVNDMGRIGCPCCGHDEKHRIMGSKCPDCNGTGIIEGVKNTEQADHSDSLNVSG